MQLMGSTSIIQSSKIHQHNKIHGQGNHLKPNVAKGREMVQEPGNKSSTLGCHFALLHRRKNIRTSNFNSSHSAKKMRLTQTPSHTISQHNPSSYKGKDKKKNRKGARTSISKSLKILISALTRIGLAKFMQNRNQSSFKQSFQLGILSNIKWA